MLKPSAFGRAADLALSAYLGSLASSLALALVG
jgi:hypothetical protein